MFHVANCVYSSVRLFSSADTRARAHKTDTMYTWTNIIIVLVIPRTKVRGVCKGHAKDLPEYSTRNKQLHNVKSDSFYVNYLLII